MMKVLILTVGSANVASTRYRFTQFESSLQNVGVKIVHRMALGFKDWDLARSQDLVVLQKRLMRVSWVKRLREYSQRLIFDTDDAIWEPHGKAHSWWTRYRTYKRLRAITSVADCCTVPNERLAAYLRPMARRVRIIPMALDEDEWFPKLVRQPGVLRIGWSGAPSNLAYLTRLKGVLQEIQQTHSAAELVVYCGEAPDFGGGVNFIHIPFAPGREADAVRTFDIGLLPLPDNAFAAGKSPIKALQYAACGIPCIASPVGATRELVLDGITGITADTDSEWKAAIIELIENSLLRERLGTAARVKFRDQHTCQVVQKQFVDCWRDID